MSWMIIICKIINTNNVIRSINDQPSFDFISAVHIIMINFIYITCTISFNDDVIAFCSFYARLHWFIHLVHLHKINKERKV